MIPWCLVSCPACGRPLELLAPQLDNEAVCPYCEALLVVSWLRPRDDGGLDAPLHSIEAQRVKEGGDAVSR